MRFRFGKKSGEEIPALGQSLTDLHASLASQQPLWAEQLARDPASFAQLEQQVHLAFGQLADRCVAGLLAHAAAAPACADTAQKK